jgi:TPR repeat protein
VKTVGDLEIGKSHENNGRLVKAARYYQKVIDANKNSRSMLDKLFGDKANTDQAAAALDALFKRDDISADDLYLIGLMYHADKKTERNDNEAIKWLEKAYSKGSAAACLLLGTMHEQGLGGLRANLALAACYYYQAKKAGSAEAKWHWDKNISPIADKFQKCIKVFSDIPAQEMMLSFLCIAALQFKPNDKPTYNLIYNLISNIASRRFTPPDVEPAAIDSLDKIEKFFNKEKITLDDIAFACAAGGFYHEVETLLKAGANPQAAVAGYIFSNDEKMIADMINQERITDLDLKKYPPKGSGL